MGRARFHCPGISVARLLLMLAGAVVGVNTLTPPGPAGRGALKSLAEVLSDVERLPHGETGRGDRPPAASLYMSALYAALEGLTAGQNTDTLTGSLVVRSQDPVGLNGGHMRFTFWPNDLEDVVFTSVELLLAGLSPSSWSTRHHQRPPAVTVCLEGQHLCQRFRGQTRYIPPFRVAWTTYNLTDILPIILQSPVTLRIYFRSGRRGSPSAQLVLSTFPNVDEILRERSAETTDRKRRYAPPLAAEPEVTATHLCHLTEWYVSVVDLGWEDLVIQPQIISTGYCSGLCPEPLTNRKVNCTNNAYVRSVYRTRQPRAVDSPVPPASCVPVTFNTGQILYHGVNGSVIIRKVKELEVRGCGCM